MFQIHNMLSCDEEEKRGGGGGGEGANIHKLPPRQYGLKTDACVCFGCVLRVCFMCVCVYAQVHSWM